MLPYDRDTILLSGEKTSMRYQNKTFKTAGQWTLVILCALQLLHLKGWTGTTAPDTSATPSETTTASDEGQAQVHRDQRVSVPQSDLEDAIANVRQKGLMNAYPDGQFHQEKSLTRAELATILVKAFKLNSRKTPNPQPVTLTDIPANFWAANDINTVVRQGVMTGYRENRFYPDHSVSRAEAYAIFAQAYGVQQLDDATVNLVLAQYPDASQIPAWARKAMATALKNGFVDTPPQGKLRPNDPMTRGDMALALNQYLIRLGKAEPTSM